MKIIPHPRVALVHDDLMQWGGAERVLDCLCEIFPNAPIFTSLVDFENTQIRQKFSNTQIYYSFLQNIPGSKIFYKPLLPFYPVAFEQINFNNFDLVISHSTRFAKNIITKPGTLHVCYCPTPPRFLWRFTGREDYKILELPLNILLSQLRLFDRVSSSRVDHFIANSVNTQKRIEAIYKRSSFLVYPFVDETLFSDIETFDGGYF